MSFFYRKSQCILMRSFPPLSFCIVCALLCCVYSWGRVHFWSVYHMPLSCAQSWPISLSLSISSVCIFVFIQYPLFSLSLSLSLSCRVRLAAGKTWQSFLVTQPSHPQTHWPSWVALCLLQSFRGLRAGRTVLPAGSVASLVPAILPLARWDAHLHLAIRQINWKFLAKKESVVRFAFPASPFTLVCYIAFCPCKQSAKLQKPKVHTRGSNTLLQKPLFSAA